MVRMAAVLATVAMAGAAHAGDGKVSLRIIDARSHVVHILVSPAERTRVATCTGNCTLRVEPGEYFLVADDTELEEVEESFITVKDDSVVEVHHGSPARARIGKTLFITGLVAGALGFTLATSCTHDCGKTWPVVLGLGGVAAVIGGAVLWSSSTASIAVAPNKSGALGVATWRF